MKAGCRWFSPARPTSRSPGTWTTCSKRYSEFICSSCDFKRRTLSPKLIVLMLKPYSSPAWPSWSGGVNLNYYPVNFVIKNFWKWLHTSPKLHHRFPAVYRKSPQDSKSCPGEPCFKKLKKHPISEEIRCFSGARYRTRICAVHCFGEK